MRRALPVLLSTLFSIFIVRHAEKALLPPKDPPLTPAGRARAAALAHTLGDVPLKAVYATEFKRTQATAAPTARKAGLKVQVRDSGKTAELAAELRRDHASDDVLVVAHSDTIGDLVKALGGPSGIGELPETEYDDLFVVDLESSTARLHRLRYGAPSGRKASAGRMKR
jgi:broad specificity phosphatase PhoE